MAQSSSNDEVLNLPTHQHTSFQEFLRELDQDDDNSLLSTLNLQHKKQMSGNLDDDRERSDRTERLSENGQLQDAQSPISDMSDTSNVLPSIDPSTELDPEKLQILVGIMGKHWSVLAPLIKEQGINIGVDANLQEEKILSLQRKLARSKEDLQREKVRPSSDTPEDIRYAMGTYRNLLRTLIPGDNDIDFASLEKLLQDAFSLYPQFAVVSLRERQPIEEIDGLAKSKHLDKPDFQLAVIIASGWFSSRSLQLGDINRLASMTTKNTPAVVFGIVCSLSSVMIKEFHEEATVNQKQHERRTLILCRILQFLLHHIRGRASSPIDDQFEVLMAGSQTAWQNPLIKALSDTLAAWIVRESATLEGELRKAKGFTSRGRDFVLNDADLFIVDDQGRMAFIPSAEYQVDIEYETAQWTVFVRSPVLGDMSFVLADAEEPGASQSVHRAFWTQFKAQCKKRRPDAEGKRNICW